VSHLILYCAECHYAECHHAECHYAVCLDTVLTALMPEYHLFLRYFLARQGVDSSSVLFIFSHSTTEQGNNNNLR